MKNLSFTVLLMLALAWPGPASGEDDLVRVEVIVFAHAAGQSDRWPVVEAPDFSALVDPHDRTRLAAWTARPVAAADESDEGPANDHEEPQNEPFPGAGMNPGVGEPPLQASAADESRPPRLAVALGDVEPAWPNLFLHDGELTSSMRRALSRLESSADYTVLSVTSWLQPLARGINSPAVRIHDATPVRVAWLDLPRLDSEYRDRITGPALLPRSHFRLDGSVRVRQRQFRHVDLDLFWSEPLSQGVGTVTLDNRRLAIHRLHQSRPVQLDRLEYFDSSWLGVLVLIRPWERPDDAQAGPE